MKKFGNKNPGTYLDPFGMTTKTNRQAFEGAPTSLSDENLATQQDLYETMEALVTSFPSHLYVPDGSQSLDMRRLVSVATGTVNEEIFRFQAPKGQRVWFLGYSIFSDGTLAASQEFIPRVDGNRVFPYHGDPNNSFKINLGLGPDMSNQNIIHCQLPLEPGQVLTWSVTNTSGVAIAMGVRMTGYLDSQNLRAATRVGG